MIVSVDLPTEMVERIDRLSQKFAIPPSPAEFVQWLVDVALYRLATAAAGIREQRLNHRGEACPQ